MSTQLQLRRGTDTATATFVGAQAEITIDTDTNRIHVHDGTTRGGHPAARLDEVFLPPQRTITSGPTALAAASDCVLLVDLSASPQVLTIDLLPSAQMKYPLKIKDIGGTSSQYPITVVPATGENIDKLTQYVIQGDRELAIFVPLAAGGGTFVE